MKPITNIYILADCSFRMNYHISRLFGNLVKTKRAINFIPERTKLHIWKYDDRVHIFHTTDFAKVSGNPNLGEGLKMLKNLILSQRKQQPQTRSIFILHGGSFVLQGWQQPLKELFDLKEFSFGLRYVVTYGKPDYYAKKAYSAFVDTPERILPHFSESRLCSLVANLNREL